MIEEIFQNLDNDFFAKLENMGEERGKRLMILFSSVPESGKEELARRIAEKFKGILVSKDKARNLIYKYKQGVGIKEVEDILDEYMETAVERLAKSSNGLIVHDASIDRKYEKYREWASTYGYEIFVIRADTDREIVAKNIEEKFQDDEGTKKWFIDQFDIWYKDFEDYRKQGKVDFVIKNNDENEIQELLKTIELKAKS